MRFTSLTLSLALAATSLATLDPATSNTKGKCPQTNSCSPQKTSSDIQAAECAHNTRVHGKQTYAVFKTAKTTGHGAPYGTCSAYTCAAPADNEMVAHDGCWTFFWSEQGESSGVGTGCIKDPQTGECGCENSNGQFIAGSNRCS